MFIKFKFSPISEGPLALLFCISGDICPGFQIHFGSLVCMLHCLCAGNSSDSPLMGLVLTSLWLAWQSRIRVTWTGPNRWHSVIQFAFELYTHYNACKITKTLFFWNVDSTSITLVEAMKLFKSSIAWKNCNQYMWTRLFSLKSVLLDAWFNLRRFFLSNFICQILRKDWNI